MASPIPTSLADTPSLAGLRVLDMSRILAGPWCAQILADLGAEVIKVERPGAGDDSRKWEPSFEAANEARTRTSAYFCAANRGKRSVTVNIAVPQGAELIRKLAAMSDVLIENYKAGDLDRYGIGYKELSEINPRLVVCSITGFGQSGPYSPQAGYDTIIQSMGGLMSITGERDDLPGGGPQRAGLPVVDILTGVYASTAILAALRQRDVSGKGQHIDLGLLDVQVSSLSYFGVDYLATGRIPIRRGNFNPVTYPSGVFRCADEQVVVLVGNDEQFERFCEVLGLPRLRADERFATTSQRVQHHDALDELILPLLAAAPAAHWIKRFAEVGVPCGAINDVGAVFADPHVQARGATTTVEHPELGTIPLLCSPIRMSRTPPRYEVAPPMLGEHTQAVLGSLLGVDERAFQDLQRSGAV